MNTNAASATWICISILLTVNMVSIPSGIYAEAGHRVNSQCLLGLAAIKSGERLDWDPVAEQVSNSVQGEELMKYSFHRDPWKLANFV